MGITNKDFEECSSNTTQHGSTSSSDQRLRNVHPDNRTSNDDSLNATESLSTQRIAKRQRRPDRAVYVPRAQRSQTTSPQSVLLSALTKTNLAGSASGVSAAVRSARIVKKAENSKAIQPSLADPPVAETASDSNLLRNKTSSNCDNELNLNAPNNISNSLKINKISHKADEQFHETLLNASFTENSKRKSISEKVLNGFLANSSESSPKIKMSSLRIEDLSRQYSSEKEDKESREFQKASKEINRSNRRIIKQSFHSDVLEIPDKVSPSLQTVADANVSPAAKKTVDIENDDWDQIFDENGDCLDPKILEDLTASVGKVKIETPKSDYKSYYIKQSILNEDEFPHVLEVSNFPAEFKTQDLLMIFSGYKESGFEIKWVDDTHALAIFSSSKSAAEAFSLGHPFVRLRPLAEASAESKAKARKCASSLQPYRPRPETCVALARRLVTGALGVRLTTASAERENEKRVLKEAKERRMLAAKQRDEAWES